MKKTVKLFVYGTLQPGLRPPASMTHHEPDVVAGELFDLGDYPAAIRLGEAETFIPGYVITIDDEELAAVDDYEDVASGEYRRILVTTRGGHAVFAYEYALPLPEHAIRIPKWRTPFE